MSCKGHVYVSTITRKFIGVLVVEDTTKRTINMQVECQVSDAAPIMVAIALHAAMRWFRSLIKCQLTSCWEASHILTHRLLLTSQWPPLQLDSLKVRWKIRSMLITTYNLIYQLENIYCTSGYLAVAYWLRVHGSIPGCGGGFFSSRKSSIALSVISRDRY